MKKPDFAALRLDVETAAFRVTRNQARARLALAVMQWREHVLNRTDPRWKAARWLQTVDAGFMAAIAGQWHGNPVRDARYLPRHDSAAVAAWRRLYWKAGRDLNRAFSAFYGS